MVVGTMIGLGYLILYLISVHKSANSSLSLLIVVGTLIKFPRDS